jgi:trigger factor
MDVKNMPFPQELFATKAERRVRLGLILSQLVGDNKLQATQEQVKAQIEDFAQSYEDPKEVLKYYYSDRRRLSEVEALVLEENVVNYVLGKAKVTAKPVAFDELMGSNAQA